MKGAVITGAAAYATLGSFPFGGIRSAGAAQRTKIGELDSVTVRCISETGWWSTPKLLKDIMASGGLKTSQYRIKWDSPHTPFRGRRSNPSTLGGCQNDQNGKTAA